MIPSENEALAPLLNRYQAKGSTGRVDYKTTKPCQATEAIQNPTGTNLVALTWAQQNAFRMSSATGCLAHGSAVRVLRNGAVRR